MHLLGGVQGKHLRHLAQPECVPEVKGMPQLQPYWAAGFSFSRGHFVATTPYDLYQPVRICHVTISITICTLYSLSCASLLISNFQIFFIRKQMIFQGEEMSITLRGFTAGYDFYSPEKSVW